MIKAGAATAALFLTVSTAGIAAAQTTIAFLMPDQASTRYEERRAFRRRWPIFAPIAR
jgi:hypothetical protein